MTSRNAKLGSVLALVFAATPVTRAGDAHDDALARVRTAEEARIEVMRRAARSVVCIFDEKHSGGGSGVVIGQDGLGLTNFHVVAEMLATRKGWGGLADGKRYPLQVLGIDPTGDVAMFRLSGKPSFDAAPLGDSRAVRVGDWVFAMGNPFLLAEDYTPTVTHGIVSGVDRYQVGADGRSLVYTGCIQVDASINPGNSGGPLFNMNGEVIGVNGRASFEQRGRVNVGLGYAISIHQIRRFIPALRAGLVAEHGSLAATVIDLGYRRAVFEKMLEPSIATTAGIAIGDRLVGFAGREMHTANEFGNALGTFPAGWPVAVVFEHDGKMVTKTVRLERLPVRMPEPFSPDKAVNRTEVERVLQPCRAALGRIPPDVTLRQQQHRTQASESVTADKLWLATWRAVYSSPADQLDSWKHVGGDDVNGEIADVLEFTPQDGERLRLAIHPTTHEPVRAWWRPASTPDPKKPPIELQLGDYRPVGEVRLPHQLRATLLGDAIVVDEVEHYELEGRP